MFCIAYVLQFFADISLSGAKPCGEVFKMDDKPCEPRFWLKRLRSVWCAVCQSPPLPPHPPPNATHRIEGAVSDLREREQAGGHITPLDEVQMVIDKETGIDRLRKMFTKECVFETCNKFFLVILDFYSSILFAWLPLLDIACIEDYLSKTFLHFA